MEQQALVPVALGVALGPLVRESLLERLDEVPARAKVWLEQVVHSKAEGSRPHRSHNPAYCNRHHRYHRRPI